MNRRSLCPNLFPLVAAALLALGPGLATAQPAPLLDGTSGHLDGLLSIGKAADAIGVFVDK